jgi:hypothetical protein
MFGEDEGLMSVHQALLNISLAACAIDGWSRKFQLQRPGVRIPIVTAEGPESRRRNHATKTGS